MYRRHLSKIRLVMVLVLAYIIVNCYLGAEVLSAQRHSSADLNSLLQAKMRARARFKDRLEVLSRRCGKLEMEGRYVP